MANATFVADGANATLTGTAANDTVTVDLGGAGPANTYTINTGGGSDTVIFDDVLGAAGFTATGPNQFTHAGGEVFDLSAVETIEFTNGTITSNASVTPETLMSGPINQDITTLVGGADDTATFNTGTLLTWDGSSTSPSAGWTIQSINGVSSSANALITVLDGTTVQGRVQVNGGNNGFDIQAESAFHTALDIGEIGVIDVDLVLTNGTDTFNQTVTVDVVGIASDADNTFIDDNTAATGVAPATTFDLLGGDDRAFGNGGADSIFGGEGNDAIYAGGDDDSGDLFIGGNGNDILGGGTGNDTLIGDAYDDGTTNVGATADQGVNEIFGGEGDDLIAIGGWEGGVAFSNLANTGLGNTGGSAFGGAGNDFILGTAAGGDLVGMGDGNDTVLLEGNGDNTIYAGADDTGNDVVTVSGTGTNEIYTGAGVDNVTVGNGDNTVGLGAGNDVFNNGGVTGDNEIFGGEGSDAITTGSGDDTVFGGADNDTINLIAGGNNEVDGGDGDDAITGGAGNDVVNGGAGIDTINMVAGGINTVTGGTGNDVITAGAPGAVDTFVFAEGDGNDAITGFTVNEDKIDLSSLGVTSLGDLVTVETGGNTTIYYGDGDSILLNGVALAALDDADFIF